MKNSIKSFYLVILFLVAGSAVSFAQTGSIKGKVTDKSGEPIQFVNISIKETKQGAVSNEDGEFLIKNINAGQVTLVMQFVGLKTLESKVNVKAGAVSETNFSLEEGSNELSEVTVMGVQSANEKVVTIGKIAIKPMDLPQAVATIDRTVLERQQVLRLSDALMNANGVYIMGNTGGYQEEIAGRGFAFGSSNTFKNGARYFNGTLPEMSSIEKIEIMKGSTAILFGNVAAGGILNLVTKKPKFESGGSVSMRLGSYEFYKPTVDLYGSILGSKNVAYRINGTYEKGNSFRENVNSERVYVNPSLLFKLSDKTEIIVEGDYMKDRRTADFGVGAINYVITDLPREKFIGVKWSYFDIKQQSANVTINHQINNNWKISGTGAYRAYQSELFATTRPTTIAANGNLVRSIQRSEVDEKYFMGQVDLTGQFKTGKIEHNVLIGTDVDSYNTKTTSFTSAVYDTINVFSAEIIDKRSDRPNLATTTITTAPVNRAGVYAQDLISFSDKFKFLAGLRYSYQETKSSVLTVKTNATVESSAYDDALSPRLGLVYQPNKRMAFFSSYSNSFTLNTGVDIYGTALKPSLIDQVELGMKNELFNGLVSANVTVYQIKNSNLAQTALFDKDGKANSNTNIKELAGEVTSQGVEVDLKSKPFLGFSLMAGYSYNETKYTKSNIYIVGSLLRYNPNHTANSSIYYTFSGTKLKGLNLGLTAMYFGERVAGRSTRLTVANDAFKLIAVNAYTQIDASIGYNFKKYSVRGKVSNILNEMSYNIHDDNSVNPIAPRMLSLTVAYKW
ncbi:MULTISPECIES: TonB-dependent receptor [unclassified Arcicella]|uniref:TonB-dependent receptor n=1 Tax=unclassified Arcicella TaxID=2644986 RepID=UPI0028633457|nr:MULTISPECIES: TonB-dependent receptor [unclassified Arcicella]MDR6563080.1 iron complex outermembrane receptor protein [Arcicella sp. BE51]MDR6811769.1 iron complex outermembrane receptor protein [Arcicella sp. BE140]MDR6823294.1 iron complex outermembrane receptor protein [Arcicella sp. BE139]